MSGAVTVARRKALWRDRFRAYVVLIDGQPVGKLSSGEEATFALTPGPHEVRMKIDWCGSPPITVDGSIPTRLVCETGGSAITALLDITARTENYISLIRA